MKFIFIGDITEENGKTIRENNLSIKHKIPIGQLVELRSDSDYGWEGIRLFVTSHTRDCDGTPLYSVGYEKSNFLYGLCEDSLVIKEIDK